MKQIFNFNVLNGRRGNFRELRTEQACEVVHTALIIHILRDVVTRVDQMFRHVFIEHNNAMVYDIERSYIELFAYPKDVRTAYSIVTKCKNALKPLSVIETFLSFYTVRMVHRFCNCKSVSVTVSYKSGMRAPLITIYFFSRGKQSFTVPVLSVSLLVIFTYGFTWSGSPRGRCCRNPRMGLRHLNSFSSSSVTQVKHRTRHRFWLSTRETWLFG